MGALDQFLCDAVREKCFAKTGIAIEKEIFKRMVEIPDKINGLKYSLIDTSGYNLFIFYDCESKVYNTLPDSGKHTFYQVMYNLQNHEMRIIKYTKKF